MCTKHTMPNPSLGLPISLDACEEGKNQCRVEKASSNLWKCVCGVRSKGGMGAKVACNIELLL
jgi:hypothetical protein